MKYETANRIVRAPQMLQAGIRHGGRPGYSLHPAQKSKETKTSLIKLSLNWPCCDGAVRLCTIQATGIY
jgi:hypothetical protein